MYLLDTMVVSERTKARPERRVLAWLDARAPSAMFLSVLSIGEILFGVRRMPPGDRQSRLEAWLSHDLPHFFDDRLLAIDERVARAWAHLSERAARTLPQVDALIAATAMAHDLTLVTRNVRDVALLGIRVENPWE